MMQQQRRIIHLFSLLLVSTSAFSARTVVVQPSLVRSSSALNAGAVWSDDDDDSNNNNNNSSNNFLSRNSDAIDCANSDETCSLDEARSYLDEMVQQIQRNENVDAATEVVTNLRQTIDTKRNELSLFQTATTVANVAAAAYVVYALLHDLDASAVADVHTTLATDAPMMAAFDEYQYTLF